MTLKFGNAYTEIELEEKENCLFFKRITCFGTSYVYHTEGAAHSFIYLIGKNYVGKLFNRYGRMGEKLFYVNSQENSYDSYKEFIVYEKNETLSVKTIYTLYNNSAVLSCRKEVTSLSDEEILLECVCPLALKGIMVEGTTAGLHIADNDNVDVTAGFGGKSNLHISDDELPALWKAHNGWFMEACFEKFDLKREGLRGKGRMKRTGKISVCSNGSQTTNRYLPLGIFEKKPYGFLMFELLPTGSWSYEIEAGLRGYDDGEVTLAITDKTFADNAWYRALKKGEMHKTNTARIVGARDLDKVLEHITILRRNVKRKVAVSPHKQIIYNNFQQNMWSNPTEEKDGKYIPYVADYGTDYYVVDAGWHDTGIEANRTQQIGNWQEDNGSYPSGFLATANKIRKAGMKFGLWLELQSVGYFCKDQGFVPEDCYFHIHGKRPLGNNRYQLNYARKEVRDYATGIVDSVVERYSPDYIKIDYNHTQLGTECESGSLAEGLALHAEGYLKWFEAIQNKYPNIIFETCASGGMFMDSHIASISSVFSVSDQEYYYNYPPMVANLPFTVLPEQMGIWCMPMREREYPNTTDEQVIMNVVNCLFGVMHFASKIDALQESHRKLLQEGFAYYRSLAEIKDKAIPIMPNGFASLSDDVVFAGLKYGHKLYVTVSNMTDKAQNVKLDLSSYKVCSAELAYPKKGENAYSLTNGFFECSMAPISARAFEFEIKN